MAKDLFHNTVKTALQKDGWLITHDPYPLQYGVAEIYVDLAAEEAIAAEKEGRTIAVEIKSFASPLKHFRISYGPRPISKLSDCYRTIRRTRAPYFIWQFL